MAKLIGFEYWTRFDEVKGSVSFKDVCERAGVNYGSMKDAKAQKRLPRLETSMKLAEVLGVTNEYLMYGTEDKHEVEQEDPRLQELIALCKENPKLLDTLLSVAHLTLGK